MQMVKKYLSIGYFSARFKMYESFFQVRYINDNRAMVKYMRRLAKKHSPLELDLGRVDPNEVATLFCTAIKEILPRKDQPQVK